METVKSYQCPCCGAPLIFQGEKLRCESCGNEFPPETLEELGARKESRYDWDHYEPRDFTQEEGGSLAGYSCPSCGAAITGDDSLGATVCPYCGNATIVKSRFEGGWRPDYLIPFKVDKQSAIAAFEQDFKTKPFLPDSFRNKKKMEEMTGIYVPFWMFDCDCRAQISYRAEQVTCWSDTDYDYTKTDHFMLLRSGQVGFANLPVDASKKADDAYMEAVEPYDYRDAVTFDPAYLSGYLAERYDVSAEDSVERANQRVKRSTEAAFYETTSGYTSVAPERTDVQFTNGKIRYALLPVWMLHIRYADQMYRFAVNGQTGKVVGQYPVDKKKKWGYFAKVAAICYGAAAAVAWLLLR